MPIFEHFNKETLHRITVDSNRKGILVRLADGRDWNFIFLGEEKSRELAVSILNYLQTERKE